MRASKGSSEMAKLGFIGYSPLSRAFAKPFLRASFTTRCSLSAGVGVSVAPNLRAAVSEAVLQASSTLEGAKATVALVTATADRDLDALNSELVEALPEVSIHGLTTCASVLHSGRVLPNGVGVLLLAAGESAITSACPVGADAETPFDAGKRAAEKLVAKAPSLPSIKYVFLSATPGIEEAVVAGIQSVIGEAAPLFGGSAADNAVEGQWKLITSSHGVFSKGVSLLAVVGDKVKVGASLIPPYFPTSKSAKITKAEGRTILTLDDRPATDVLGEWIGESVREQVVNGGSIIVQAASFPLGIEKGPGQYVAIHAAQMNIPERSVSCFAEVEEGQVLTVMNNKGGSDSVCAASAGLNEAYEKAALQGDITSPTAGLLVYCGGMSIAVGDGLAESMALLKEKALPLLGMTVFGEQGSFGGRNLHTNLAVGIALFE